MFFTGMGKIQGVVVAVVEDVTSSVRRRRYPRIPFVRYVTVRNFTGKSSTTTVEPADRPILLKGAEGNTMFEFEFKFEIHIPNFKCLRHEASVE
jgi:hypothetical protein